MNCSVCCYNCCCGPVAMTTILRIDRHSSLQLAIPNISVAPSVKLLQSKHPPLRCRMGGMNDSSLVQSSAGGIRIVVPGCLNGSNQAEPVVTPSVNHHHLLHHHPHYHPSSIIRHHSHYPRLPWGGAFAPASLKSLKRTVLCFSCELSMFGFNAQSSKFRARAFAFGACA